MPKTKHKNNDAQQHTTALAHHQYNPSTCLPYKPDILNNVKLEIFSRVSPESAKKYLFKMFDDNTSMIVKICYKIHNDTFSFLLQNSTDDFLQKLKVLMYYTDSEQTFALFTPYDIRQNFFYHKNAVLKFIEARPTWYNERQPATLEQRVQNFADLIRNIMSNIQPNTPKLKITLISTQEKAQLEISEEPLPESFSLEELEKELKRKNKY